ncbi:MAG: 4-hydroxythreonine-4-phosphate dehydrogenase [Bacteriovoracaceae bacterium]|jgi:4-hydroxythreonine-4-phosphate dehydrogenase
MIYVSQGHEKGIGIEVFIKAFLCLSSDYQSQFKIIINQNDLKNNLEALRVPYTFENSSLILGKSSLNCIFFDTQLNSFNSTTSLDLAVGLCKPNDILLTLPTSKDQLFFKDSQVNGHTEYFRKMFNREEIAMSFLGENSNFLLLSDHIAINEVIDYLNPQFIVKKVSIVLQEMIKAREIKEVFFAGINPHCGEDGNISSADKMIDESILILKDNFTDILFHDQLPGDTIHFNLKHKNQLFIYPYHDQGLAPFKLKYGLTGINFSMGLPFKRVSVDHGTAFSLWGKNQANYIGMIYLLNEIENWA